ncbi:MAG TPA: DUF6468 domain-containing protein [Devosia sp.]|nr:DUF6468 domain-containing protein [Devosia sp.]
MFGLAPGFFVESAVAILLLVTIGYCVVLNHRLKRLHQDRDTMSKTVAELVQATALANAAVRELKTAALEADNQLSERLHDAEKFAIELSTHITSGSMLVERIARITAAAKPAVSAAPTEPKAQPKQEIEPQGRLQSALQQLAMRPGIGGKAA